ncbi:hypothetical protein [Lutibaculum baratangense]|uniref:Uncharacterized protein n=1 Tax=Lutibaculum baratangense AMV1 TaxID=631454 RepID=V4RUK0_9HYPH|nr:hypothetical protein [Lutibaculum baratangense]ESR26750.1 hypothetical protein N177_0534 [Lutibaculum baratangense AMV1]
MTRRTCFRILSTCLLAAFLASLTPVLAAQWARYDNERFGYSLRYPADIFAQAEPSQNGDGITLFTRDGRARLIVFGGHNALGHDSDTIARELSSLEDISEVTYRRVADRWIVLSGYLKDSPRGEEMIFYERVEFSPSRDAISGFRIEYPTSMREPIDSLIGPIGRSLTAPAPR